MKNKLLTVVVTLSMVVTSLFSSGTVLATTNVQTDYEIYPTPHKVVYKQGEYIIRPNVNAIIEEKIDSATTNRLDEIFSSKNKNVTKETSKQEGKTNIYLGIYDSNKAVDQYVKTKYKFNKDIFKKEGAYFLASNNDEIVVLGKNTDAVFYGLTTLKHIFKQMDGSTIRNFEIEDYANTKIRGFIEGYYGIPWSNEDRMELMKFGGDFKMTSYIFAPKNDPYHKEKWREEYPADELAKLKKMVEVGNQTKCRFVWTAHPFMGGFNEKDYKNEIQKLIAKFEHLYTDAGVRQFGVLGDDVGGLPRSIVIEMMQEVSKWAKSKGDVYDTVFCPGGYNHSWQKDYSELNEYDKGFPENIQIFWTGEAVCQPIEQKTLDHFRNYNSNHHGKRRAPLFWLNWPVNDINHSRMLMGHGTKMLQNNINVEDLAGAVTNPMQESEPSKVAIFQLADYTWNVKGYTGKKSWEDSFKYIEPDADDELYTLAKHMSNPEPNGHWLVMPESEELAPKLNAFKEALDNGQITTEAANDLVNEFEVIIAACNDLHTKSKNSELKKDLKPFTDSLKDLCEANVNYIKAKLALDKGNKLEAFNFYTAGQNEYNASTKHAKPMLGGGTEFVDPGSTHLIPFAKKLEKILSTPMNEFVAGTEGEAKLQITASSSYNTWEQGNINNIIDGNEKNHAWHNGYAHAGDYFQVNFSIPQTVYGVHILNGAAAEGKEHDTFQSGKVMYQVKGEETWKQLGEEKYGNYPTRVDISRIEVKDVTAVRYECVDAGTNWPSMREFRVSIQPENGTQFTKTVVIPTEGWSVSSGSKENVVDGNPNTNVHFNVRQSAAAPNTNSMLPGDFVEVQLSEKIELGKIDILQGRNDSDGDYMKKAKLQYHDGSQWKDVPDAIFTDQRHIKIDLSNKKIKTDKVRLVCTEKQPTWLGVREFDIKEKVYYNAKAYTNVDELKTLGANVYNESSSLASKDGITLNKGQYVGIELDRIHEITSITKELENANGITLEVGMNEYEFKAYEEGKSANARFIRLINKTEAPITFNLKKLATTSREYYPKSFLAADSNFAIYEANSKPASNLFDGDWTNQVIFQASQHQGNKFVYDLGQEMDINKLKVVCRDSEHDFPRHAKIEVSTNKQNWETIMTLGNQNENNPGEAENKDEIGFVLPNHETSYNTKEVSLDSAKKARYIKFEITRNKAGSDKWVRFQEFIINDGAYVPTVNDPTFESDVKDTYAGKYEYLTDGDITTSFIPSEKNGKLTYHLSKNNNVNTIKLVQAIDPISNAVVKARVQGQEGLITLGTLSQTVNEFVLPDNTVLFDVVIEWNNVTPMLKEMVLLNTKYGETNKAELDKLLTEKVDTSSWTTGSKKSYEAAIEAGKKVKASEKISQTSIDSAVIAIKNAKENAEIKGDMTLLENALQNSVKDKENYTAKSWRLYENALNAIKAAKENAENTSNKDVEKLLANLEDAKNKLVYNPSNMEESVLAVQAENDFIASVEKADLIYTENSWKAYKDAKNTVNALIEQNKETAVHPTKFKKALDSMNASKDALVNVSELKALIKEYEGTDKSLYSKESFSKYEKAVNDSKALLVNGPNESIANAINEINIAKKALQLNTSNTLLDTLNKLIKEIESLDASNYTKESFNKLNSVLNEVKNKDLANLTEKELNAEISKLNDAKNQLVSVEALKESLKVAQGLDKNLYTSSSYKNLEKLIADSQTLFNDGTKEEISKQISKIDQAVKGLVLRANENDVKEYLESIQLVDGSLYTKESYDAYMSAYNSLNKLAADLDNLSAETYLKAKDNFEAAKANLVKLTDKQPTDSSNGSSEKPSTGSSTNTALLWSVLLGAGAVLLLTLKRRNVETE